VVARPNPGFEAALPVRSQIRAVASPAPEASRDSTGFHAQMYTSDSWPYSVCTADGGTSRAEEVGGGGGGGKGEEDNVDEGGDKDEEGEEPDAVDASLLMEEGGGGGYY